MYNSLSWKEIIKLDMSAMNEITKFNSRPEVNIFQETESREGSLYEPKGKPFTIPTLTNPNPTQKGIQLMTMSLDGKYLALKNMI